MSIIASRILSLLQKMIKCSVILASCRARSPQLAPTYWDVCGFIEKRAQSYVYTVLRLQIISHNRINFHERRIKKTSTISFLQVNLDTHRILHQTRTCRSRKRFCQTILRIRELLLCKTTTNMNIMFIRVSYLIRRNNTCDGEN